MTGPLVKAVVRKMLQATSRERAAKQARRHLAAYLDLAKRVGPEEGRRPVRVPEMRGVDEDMRDWSFFQVLGHNAIASRSISAIVGQLARGEPLAGAALIDPKVDVMPAADAGPERVEVFEAAVEGHLAMLPSLGELRGTATAPHPVFGDFDAHLWNAMFSFHLKLHLPQAEHVVKALG